MRMRSLAGAVVICLAVTACGTEPSSSSGPTSVGTERCGGSGTGPCDPDPSTTATTRGCGVVTAELVTAALGVPATSLGQDVSGCGFSAGQWSLGVSAEPYHAATQSGATQRVVNNDRSGLWQVHGGIVVDGVLYTYWLRNSATGADTYPGFEGPEQKPLTAAAAASLEDAIAQAG